MKTYKFVIELESNLTDSQEDDLFVDLRNTILQFEEYNCIDIKALNISTDSSDISQIHSEYSTLKDNDENKETINSGFIMTEIKSIFLCHNCHEEIENEAAYSKSDENNEIVICRKCYKELENEK